MHVRWPRRATVVAILFGVLVSWAGDRPRAQQAGGGAGYPDAMFSGLKWRSVGPDRGGRSIAVAGSASRPLEYYFGATGGGLWKTTDGGTTWSPAADKFLRSSSVGAVAVAEANPDIVYVGMGEVQLRGNIIQGDGLCKTTDGGKTWAHIGLGDSMAVARVRVGTDRGQACRSVAIMKACQASRLSASSPGPPCASRICVVTSRVRSSGALASAAFSAAASGPLLRAAAASEAAAARAAVRRSVTRLSTAP